MGFPLFRGSCFGRELTNRSVRPKLPIINNDKCFQSAGGRDGMTAGSSRRMEEPCPSGAPSGVEEVDGDFPSVSTVASPPAAGPASDDMVFDFRFPFSYTLIFKSAFSTMAVSEFAFRTMH